MASKTSKTHIKKTNVDAMLRAEELVKSSDKSRDLMLRAEDMPHQEAAKFVCKDWETKGESLDLSWAINYMLKGKNQTLCFDALARVLVGLSYNVPKEFVRALSFDLKLALDCLEGFDPLNMTDIDRIKVAKKLAEWGTEENREKRKRYISGDEESSALQS